MKYVFSLVHHQCKIHGENLYITLVNVVNKIKMYLDITLWLFWEKQYGAFPPTLPYVFLLNFAKNIITFKAIAELLCVSVKHSMIGF